MWRISIVVLAIVIGSVQPARADLAGSFYDDVRDVVEELIQTEVTTSVVTTIEKHSPALAFYMHGTLERLGSPYWGSLARVMKDDLTIVVADFVYWHVSTGGGDGDIIASAKRFFACKRTPDGDEACNRLVAAISGQHRPLLEVECRRAKPTTADRRVACDLGLAVLAALERRGEVRHHIVDALADVVLGELADRALADRLRDVLTKWMDLPKDLPTPLLEALGNPDLADQLKEDAIEKQCTDPKTIDDLFRDPLNSRAWICFAVTHPALPNALAATVTVRDGKRPILEQRIDYWIIQAALKDFDADKSTDDSSFRLLAELAIDVRCPAGAKIDVWPCKGAALTPGATITVSWLGRELAGTVSKAGPVESKPSGEMRAWLLRFRKAMRRIEELRALVPPSLTPYLFYAGTTPPDSKSVLRSISRMARLVTELRARWYLWASSDKSSIDDLDIAELLRVARDAFSGSTTLAFLDKHASGGASSIDIGDWLRMVMRGDYRALAMESLRSALDVKLSDQNRPKEKFFLTLAAYLLDSNEGVSESVARSAFRAAAKDLLLSQKQQGVPRVGDRVALRPLPLLSIRLSFNDTYAITDGDSRRNVVAADWPTMMVAVNDYMGVEASILDPVAPLSEMALRPAGTYHGYPYVALDVLRPRFGGWICVPQFSRRLTLSSGFGARFLNVVRESPIDMPLIATYGTRVSLMFDTGLQFVF